MAITFQPLKWIYFKKSRLCMHVISALSVNTCSLSSSGAHTVTVGTLDYSSATKQYLGQSLTHKKRLLDVMDLQIWMTRITQNRIFSRNKQQATLTKHPKQNYATGDFWCSSAQQCPPKKEECRWNIV